MPVRNPLRVQAELSDALVAQLGITTGAPDGIFGTSRRSRPIRVYPGTAIPVWRGLPSVRACDGESDTAAMRLKPMARSGGGYLMASISARSRYGCRATRSRVRTIGVFCSTSARMSSRPGGVGFGEQQNRTHVPLGQCPCREPGGILFRGEPRELDPTRLNILSSRGTVFARI